MNVSLLLISTSHLSYDYSEKDTLQFWLIPHFPTQSDILFPSNNYRLEIYCTISKKQKKAVFLP